MTCSSRRINIVVDSLDPRRGGVEGFLFRLAVDLSAYGHPVQVLCRNHDCPVGPFSVREFRGLPWPRFYRDLKFTRSIESFATDGARETILAVRPLLGATHYLPPSGLYKAVFEAERRALTPGIRKRLYGLGLRLNLKRRLLIATETAMFARQDPPWLMVRSNVMSERFQEQYRIPREKIAVLRHGIDRTRFRPGRGHCEMRSCLAGDDELLLLFVANNFLLKGLHALLLGLSSRPRLASRVRLLVAGRGPVSPFRRLATRLKLGARVHFLGALPQSVLVELYRAADVFVHPTFHDHFSQVVLEALACGCPVITTRNEGAAEVLESGKQGFVIHDPWDSESLLAALEFLKSPSRRRRMGNSAAELARQFSLTNHTEQVRQWLCVPQQHQ